MSFSFLSTPFVMPQVNVRVNEGFASFFTVGLVACFCCGSPGRTKQVPSVLPLGYSLAHSAASSMCSRIVCAVGTPALHVAVPIVLVVLSNRMLLFWPPGRSKAKNLSDLEGSVAVHLLPSAPLTLV